MLQFDEYKVKLNNLAPTLEELGKALDLESAERELDMLQAESAADGFWNNLEKAQKVQQRIKNLQDKVDKQNKRRREWDDLMALCEMGNEFEDESLLPELEEGFAQLERDMEEARLQTLLTGEYDSSNVILTIHPGAGGTEAQDWAQMLYRMYTRWTERHGFTYQIMDYQEGDEAGIKSRYHHGGGGERLRLPERASTASTVWFGYLPLMPTPGGRPPSPRWRSCLTCPRMWRWISAPRTSRCRSTAPAAPAASTSTRPPPPSA